MDHITNLSFYPRSTWKLWKSSQLYLVIISNTLKAHFSGSMLDKARRLLSDMTAAVSIDKSGVSDLKGCNGGFCKWYEEGDSREGLGAGSYWMVGIPKRIGKSFSYYRMVLASRWDFGGTSQALRRLRPSWNWSRLAHIGKMGGARVLGALLVDGQVRGSSPTLEPAEVFKKRNCIWKQSAGGWRQKKLRPCEKLCPWYGVYVGALTSGQLGHWLW